MDFIVRKEYKVLRNIFSKAELEKSENLKLLFNSDYDAFLKFLKTSVLSDNSFTKSSDLDQILDEDLKQNAFK